MAYIIDLDAFEYYWDNILQNEIWTASTGVLLYGIFMVLFLVAMHLLHRRKAPGRQALLVLTVVMAILATAQFSLHVASVSLALRLVELAVRHGRQPTNPPTLEHLYWVLVLTQDLVLVTNTVITDGLLVYRCYLVWGRPRKTFVLVPVLLMLGTLATGYVTSYDEDYTNGPPYHIDPRIVFTINLFTNFVMMCLTAGRIWWVTRAQRAVLGPQFTPIYNAAIAIILESGAIYCCGLVFQVIALSVQDSYPIVVYLSHGTISQLVNIVPTLIVVRVGLGHAIPTTVADTTSVSRLHVNVPQTLRFASASDEEAEFGANETDIQLEDVNRK